MVRKPKPTLFGRINLRLENYINNIKYVFDIPKRYEYKYFSILLPANHMLPIYQRAHPKYDRFLPHLVKYLRPQDTVIDVGANVGDTLAGMVDKNQLLNYICIEADEKFFEFLAQNIKLIKKANEDVNIKSIKSLVGKDISGVKLEGVGGTKHAVTGVIGDIQSQQLDELIINLEYRNFRLLKSDVDGFDYDVIESSINLIKNSKPIIFFECHYDFEFQKIGYEKIIKKLEDLNYCDWVVFDNFGEVILRTSDSQQLKGLINYVWHQNLGNATRTIFYFDILAIHSSDSELISTVMRDYNYY